MLNMLHLIRLDYLSCVLTVLATVLIGKKLWQGPRKSTVHRPLHQQPVQLAGQNAAFSPDEKRGARILGRASYDLRFA
jgi:hypothetical protein